MNASAGWRDYVDYCRLSLIKHYAFIHPYFKWPEVYFATVASLEFEITKPRKIFSQAKVPYVMLIKNQRHFNAWEATSWFTSVDVILSQRPKAYKH